MTLIAHDVDSHEMIPSHLLGDVFGEPGRMAGALYDVRAQLRPDPSATNMHHPGAADTMEIDEKTVWEAKGPVAPSAIDLDRRLEVMDAMGIDVQLVYPTTAIGVMGVGAATDLQFEQRYGGDDSMLGGLSRPEFARRFVDAYNDWVIAKAVMGNGRIRLVGIIPTGEVEDMIATAKRLVAGGVRVVYLQAATPPGGISPAHSAFDPMWEVLEANDIATTFHLGTEFSFVDPRWALAETFQDLFQSAEFPNTNVHLLAMSHMALDNYLGTLVLGGVFERFPRLRVAILEVGGHWIGPAAERLDLYVEVFPGCAAAKFPLKPSEYINRNVRVSPFHFEPVDKYFRTYPNLSDVFCYSSDYPHVEGGKYSLRTLEQKLEPLGEEIVTKFVKTNADWLLPA